MLKPNDSVRMNIAKWPLPMITAETLDRDWFDGITEKLHWNENIKDVKRSRKQELPFPATCSMCVPTTRTSPASPLLQSCAAAPLQSRRLHSHACCLHTSQALRCRDGSSVLTASQDDAHVPTCVRWPNPDNLMSSHHMGQDVDEVYGGMPLYCPTSDSETCRTDYEDSSDSSGSWDSNNAASSANGDAGGSGANGSSAAPSAARGGSSEHAEEGWDDVGPFDSQEGRGRWSDTNGSSDFEAGAPARGTTSDFEEFVAQHRGKAE